MSFLYLNLCVALIVFILVYSSKEKYIIKVLPFFYFCVLVSKFQFHKEMVALLPLLFFPLMFLTSSRFEKRNVEKNNSDLYFISGILLILVFYIFSTGEAGIYLQFPSSENDTFEVDSSLVLVVACFLIVKLISLKKVKG